MNTDIAWDMGDLIEANDLLRRHHYLGPLKSGGKLIIIGTRNDYPVAAAIWKHPTSRALPSDGTWFELARWCLTPDAGPNAGSVMHKATLQLIRTHLPHVTTLVSYSDPSQGHTGALYRACNYRWCPTWQRLRPPPTGGGEWTPGKQQNVKDRWIYPVRPDPVRTIRLRVNDNGAVRHWHRTATNTERRWARLSLTPELQP